MTAKQTIVAAGVAVAALWARLPAGGQGATTRPAGGGRQANVRVDRAKRQVVVPARVELREGMLEFLLCVKGVKDHETVLVTDVPPSSLHAGLLALGLMPGRPGRWGTPPGGEPVFEPPQGAQLRISLQWKDAAGKPREAPAAAWLKPAGQDKHLKDLTWVFVGSDFLDDGRYWADVEGLLVSVANFAASVIDVPFKSSDENAFREFAARTKAIPPKGTPVDVVVTVPQGQEKAPHARISFSVDEFGRIELEGQAIEPEKIASAVKKFLAAHARGSAEVRLDPRALVYDRDRLEEILSQAGLTDVSFRTRVLTAEVLPRTAGEATKAIAWWKQQFARAEDLLLDPAEAAGDVLRHIEHRRKRAEELRALWDDYAARLRALVAEHRKASPPGGGKP